MLTHSREGISRFNPAERLQINPTASIKHFNPVENGRDRFGHRVFSSHYLAYEDYTREQIKAALLVSPEGEGLIKQYPSLLRDIETGLIEMDKIPRDEVWKQRLKKKALDLNNSTKMEFLDLGRFSIACKLYLPDRTLVIKFPVETMVHGHDDPQPYFNEMLQIAALKKDLAPQLSELNTKVEFPKIFFASGQLSCSEFVEGRTPRESLFRNTELTYDESSIQREGLAWQLHDMVYRYINEQTAEGVKLWWMMTPDVIKRADFAPHLENFIQKQDGTLVWIDPLFCPLH